MSGHIECGFVGRMTPRCPTEQGGSRPPGDHPGDPLRSALTRRRAVKTIALRCTTLRRGELRTGAASRRSSGAPLSARAGQSSRIDRRPRPHMGSSRAATAVAAPWSRGAFGATLMA
jgi:hypothetical protein